MAGEKKENDNKKEQPYINSFEEDFGMWVATGIIVGIGLFIALIYKLISLIPT